MNGAKLISCRAGLLSPQMDLGSRVKAYKQIEFNNPLAVFSYIYFPFSSVDPTYLNFVKWLTSRNQEPLESFLWPCIYIDPPAASIGGEARRPPRLRVHFGVKASRGHGPLRVPESFRDGSLRRISATHRATLPVTLGHLSR